VKENRKKLGIKTGFTLIELLVTISILTIMVVVGSNMFFTILGNAAKTKVLQRVKQNGDYAISSMSRLIRNAQSLDLGSSSTTQVVLLSPDGYPTTFSCSDQKIASNGADLIDTTVVKVTNCNIFSVAPGETDFSPDVVVINFTLEQAEVTSRPEEKASLDFQTTVTLRNF